MTENLIKSILNCLGNAIDFIDFNISSCTDPNWPPWTPKPPKNNQNTRGGTLSDPSLLASVG